MWLFVRFIHCSGENWESGKYVIELLFENRIFVLVIVVIMLEFHYSPEIMSSKKCFLVGEHRNAG